MRWLGAAALLTVCSLGVPSGAAAVEGPQEPPWEIPEFRRGAWLTRGMGARPVGMGGAFTAVADDASAMAWNPAGIGQVPRFQAVVAYDGIGNDLGLSSAAVAVPMGRGAASLSIAILDYGGFDWRDADGLAGSGPRGVMDKAISVGYAHPNPPGLGGFTGVSVEYVAEGVGGSFFGGSLGMVIPMGRKLALGWAVQHISQKVDGFSLPLTAKGGASFSPVPAARLALDIGYGMAEQQMWVAAGVEYVFVSVLAVRAGYKMRAKEQGLEGMNGLTAGLGFRLGRLGIDYAYQPFGDLATTHRVALLYGLGTSSEVDRLRQWRSRDVAISTFESERTGARLAVDPVALAVKQDYQAAVRLYAAGEYASAERRATAAVNADSGHWQAWQMLGNCRYARGNKKQAMKSYRRSLKINGDNPDLKKWMEQIAK